jgi:type IV secretion system protein VirB11
MKPALVESAGVVQARQHRALCEAFGPVVVNATRDSGTTDVCLNDDGSLWQRRRGEDWKRIGELLPTQADQGLRLLASMLNTRIGTDQPHLDGVWPLDGLSRIAADMPPVTQRPTFSIRCHAPEIFPLEDFVAKGILSAPQKAAIEGAIDAHDNILVAGQTGSGKSTAIRSILGRTADRWPTERVVTIEDTLELGRTSPNSLSFVATRDFTMTDCLRAAMRAAPRRITVGEVRGPEAFDLMLAWNSGHDGGCASIHASSAEKALSKLVGYVNANPNAPRPVQPMIADAVQLVIFMTGESGESPRRVQQILRVQSWDGTRFQLTEVAQ